MKKIIAILMTVLLGMFAVAATSCDKEANKGVMLVPPELQEAYKQPITILPEETPTELHVSQFKEDFAEYLHQKNPTGTVDDYIGFCNYMPEEYARDYDVGAFKVTNKNSNHTNFYVWDARGGENGGIYVVSPWPENGVQDFVGFVHFALGDWNGDGYLEILVSYNTGTFTYVTAIDRKSEISTHASGMYDKYAYFKKGLDGNLAVYTSIERNIESAEIKYSDIVENKKKYTFAQTEYHLATTDYEVDIFLDEESINFPLYMKGLSLGFEIETKMKWLGETFFYTNSNTYLDGAYVEFLNGEHIVYNVDWGAGDAMTDFTIETNMVIENVYWCEDDIYGKNPIGVYDMEVSYRFSDETIVLKDVLTIA